MSSIIFPKLSRTAKRTEKSVRGGAFFARGLNGPLFYAILIRKEYVFLKGGVFMTDYKALAAAAKDMTEGVKYLTANLANLSALICGAMEDVSWVGFYLMEDGRLVLGPFQGKPACIEIPLGKGVCGAAASSGKTVRVRDVREFKGHIACDAASRSEIVVPVKKDGKVVAVLDVDSATVGRFTEEDEKGLEAVAKVIKF